MTQEELMLGPAAVRWNDYVGTAAADDANALPGAPSLYEVAGLDRESWVIVGVDLGVWEREPRVTVYAVDRAQGRIQTMADLDDLADANGLPVTAFQLTPSSRVEEFIEEAFQRIAIRLVARPLKDHRLVVATPALPEVVA